jgi:putative transcriptional regulator
MDSMKKSSSTSTFKEQMAGSMAELRAIMDTKASPSNNGRLTVRTIEVVEPSNYRAKDVKKIREELNVSQAVFARLVGVSDVLVRSWERGVREPAPVARRLLDQMRAYPDRFIVLVHPFNRSEKETMRRPMTSKKAG